MSSHTDHTDHTSHPLGGEDSPYGRIDRRAKHLCSCPEWSRISELYHRVERLSGLVGHYQVLDTRVKAVERVIGEIEDVLKTTSDDIHQIQLVISQNSLARVWVERAVLAVVTAAVTYGVSQLGAMTQG